MVEAISLSLSCIMASILYLLPVIVFFSSFEKNVAKWQVAFV